MTNKIGYSRQTEIFDPINQKYKIHILGAGSLGSFTALNLAKLGFNDITVYDFDRVETDNIPNQFYRMQDVDKFKTEALKEIIKEFADIEIKIKNEKVTEKTQFNLSPNNIFVLTFDSLKQRRVFYNAIKDQLAIVLDVRAGGEEYNIRITNTMDEKEMKLWDDSLNVTPTQLPCGARSVIYTNLSVASEVCNIIKKINNNEKYSKRIIRHMGGYLIVNSRP